MMTSKPSKLYIRSEAVEFLETIISNDSDSECQIMHAKQQLKSY